MIQMATALDSSANWLAAFRRYLAAGAVGHLVWESAQLPLYTLWTTASPGEMAWAVVHCTAGDLGIAAAALALALVACGRSRWPAERFGAVAAVAVTAGIAYTIYSEWLNTVARQSWAYAEAMPVVPPWGTGLTPLLQWIAIPAFCFWAARRSPRAR
jgi:hypothetical protein